MLCKHNFIGDFTRIVSLSTSKMYRDNRAQWLRTELDERFTFKLMSKGSSTSSVDKLQMLTISIFAWSSHMRIQ